MEKVFISSSMRGRSPFGDTWQNLRSAAQSCLTVAGMHVLALEKDAPDPRSPWVVFTQLVDDCTCYVGLWSSRYSAGTTAEFMRCRDKPCYIYLLGCSMTEVFRDNAPNNSQTQATLHEIRQSLSHLTYTPYPINSSQELLRQISRLGQRLAVCSRWARAATYDPTRFVGRRREMDICVQIALRPSKRAKVVVVTGPSSAGKTTFLRGLGHQLSLLPDQAARSSFIVDLDGAWPRGAIIAALIQQLGDPSAGTIFLPKNRPDKEHHVAPAQQWESQLARGTSPKLVLQLYDHLVKLVLAQELPPVVLLDDVQGINDERLAHLVRSLATSAASLTLVCTWRPEVPSRLGRELLDIANGLGSDEGAVVRLAGFDSPQVAVLFLERRIGRSLRLSDDSYTHRMLTDLLPGDLDELAQFLAPSELSSLDLRLLRALIAGSSDAINQRRWERLAHFQDDLRVLSAAGTGAPTSLMSDVARKLRVPLRRRQLIAIGTASESPRTVGGVWCKVYPERFCEFIWRDKLTTNMRRRLSLAFIRGIAAKLAKGDGEPELLQVAAPVARRLSPRSRLFWSERLGRMALRYGWLRSALDILQPFLRESELSSLGGRHRGLLLELVDVYRQLGDRGRARRLLDQIEHRCHVDKSETARMLSLRLRLTRDLKGGESAHRTARRLLKSHVHLPKTAKLLDQLARIARDTGRVAEGMSLAHQALRALRKEKRSFRSWRTEGEVLYTLGSIARLAGDIQTAEAALQRSVGIRKRNGDLQGEAYPLLELAMCAFIRDNLEQCMSWLKSAEAASSHPEIQDQRALAYSDIIQCLVAVLSDNEEEARYRLEQSARWKATQEQGIRGNPTLVEGVIEARFGDQNKAIQLLQRHLSSRDRTVRATAALVLSRSLRAASEQLKPTKLARDAERLAKRYGFSLQGIGAELVARAAAYDGVGDAMIQ